MTEYEWQRMESVKSRARDIYNSTSSSSKRTVQDYEEMLKAGDGEYAETDDGFASRTCPMCGSDKVCSVREARRVFKTSSWGAVSMLDRADRVCSWCHAARVEVEEFPDRPDGNVEDDVDTSVEGVEW